jgi:hypothetical protein
MKQNLPVAFAILLVSAIAACAPLTPAVQEAAPTQRLVPEDAFHPLTVQTGIESIDQVLSAVSSDDAGSLHSLIEFTNAKCTQQEGLGGPPKCREGEAEGTPVEVLSFLGSEGNFLRRDEIKDWTGISASGIYAIYEVNAAAISSEQYYPVGRYVIVLVNGGNAPAAALRIGESGIVRVDTLFDSSPESLRATVDREASTVILAPKS